MPWQTRGAAQDVKTNLAEQQKSLFRAIATTDESIIGPALEDVETYGQIIQDDIAVLESKALAENMGVVDDLKSKISGVVQNNSCCRGRVSATSEELYAQATTLSEIVGWFKLK